MMISCLKSEIFEKVSKLVLHTPYVHLTFQVFAEGSCDVCTRNALVGAALWCGYLVVRSCSLEENLKIEKIW